MGVAVPAARIALALGLVTLGLAGLGLPAGAAESPLLREVAGAEVDWQTGRVTARAGAAADLRLPGPDHARPAAQRAAEKRAAEILSAALSALPLGGGRRASAAAVKAAVQRAEVLDIDYQSSGGVLLSLVTSFTELGKDPAPPAAKAPAKPAKSKPTRAAPDDEAPADEPAPEKSAAPEEKAPGRAVKARHVEGGPAAAPVLPELSLSVASMPLEVAPRVMAGGNEQTVGSAVYRLGETPRGRKPLSAKRDKSGRLVVGAAGAATKWEGADVVIYLRSLGKR